MTSLEYFRLFAPEYTALTDEEVNALLAASALFISTSCLDAERAALATALYAAHIRWSIVRSASGVTGAITMEREGDLQRSYASVAGSSTSLGQSPYGLMYLDLIKGCNGASIMTRFGDAPPAFDADIGYATYVGY